VRLPSKARTGRRRSKKRKQNEMKRKARNYHSNRTRSTEISIAPLSWHELVHAPFLVRVSRRVSVPCPVRTVSQQFLRVPTHRSRINSVVAVVLRSSSQHGSGTVHCSVAALCLHRTAETRDGRTDSETDTHASTISFALRVCARERVCGGVEVLSRRETTKQPDQAKPSQTKQMASTQPRNHATTQQQDNKTARQQDDKAAQGNNSNNQRSKPNQTKPKRSEAKRRGRNNESMNEETKKLIEVRSMFIIQRKTTHHNDTTTQRQTTNNEGMH